MTRALPFGLAFVVPLLAALGVALGGAWLALPPLFLFVLTPILDALLGHDRAPFAEEKADAWRDARYDAWLWLWVPVQLAIQGAALIVAERMSPGERVGLVFASGLLGGIGINVAHELMHRKGKAERAIAEVLMTSVGYAHFCVEHVLGHHKHVATAHDPASAKRGENLYAFLPRSVIGGVRSAWRLETNRVQKLGLRGLRDRRVRYPLVMLAVVVGLGAIGPVALAVFVGQCCVAIALLEVINYVEHYGLERDPSERVRPAHSWNSTHRLTGYYLFLLPRHADHHAHASRPYFALRHLDDSPQLPAGYATMLLLALVPPLWKRVMDPRLTAHVGESRVVESTAAPSKDGARG